MQNFNCKIKHYDDDHFSITTYNYQNTRDYTKNDDSGKKQRVLDDDWTFEPSLNDVISDHRRSIEVSRNRAKNMIYDYARSNDFEWFFTLTFNPEKVDSFDYGECSKKLSKWLNNMKSKYAPDMQYIFVPELHKSCRYHFHGLVSNIGSMKMIDSGHCTSSGQVIYNVGNYKLGWTTATRIVDKQRTSTYIGKYITKDLSGHIKGKKHYWASRGLALPEVEYLTVDDLVQMGITAEFMENNSIYQKEVEYEVNAQKRRVTYYEFERQLPKKG